MECVSVCACTGGQGALCQPHDTLPKSLLGFWKPVTPACLMESLKREGGWVLGQGRKKGPVHPIVQSTWVL